eukprot:GHVS01096363.1.p2 GENE.GHVS01096363.1~~GHVS01096363.1.p2  ORF type:complete len:120 (+),score=59.21 GHVS01096363.1:76-435(+)
MSLLFVFSSLSLLLLFLSSVVPTAGQISGSKHGGGSKDELDGIDGTSGKTMKSSLAGGSDNPGGGEEEDSSEEDSSEEDSREEVSSDSETELEILIGLIEKEEKEMLAEYMLRGGGGGV